MSIDKEYAYFQCFECKRVLPLSDQEYKKTGPRICTWCNQERVEKENKENAQERSFDCDFYF